MAFWKGSTTKGVDNINRLRELEDSDLSSLAVLKLRPADVAETIAASGGAMTPNESLMYSIAKSFWTMVVEEIETGELLGAVGVSTKMIFINHRPALVGIPWSLGTERVTEDALSFVKFGKLAVARMLKTYPVLTNYVHSKNKLSIKWLKWAGFTVGEGQDLVIDDEVFLHFTISSERMENV